VFVSFGDYLGLAGLVAGLVAMLFGLWLYARRHDERLGAEIVEDIRRRIEALDSPLARTLKHGERSLKRSFESGSISRKRSSP
jgi:hypothetical protein